MVPANPDIMPWVLAVHHFMARTPDASSASEFIDANPHGSHLGEFGLSRTCRSVM